jgi:peroxiredoxin
MHFIHRRFTMLQPNDQFPSITITTPDGAPLELPDALGGGFGVVLFFRGAWCPYCNAQLRAFQRAQDKLSELDIKVVALSVDDGATTRELIEKHGLTFPVGHSADARAVAQETGAFVNEDPLYLQSTGFVLAPDGRVVVSVYSSGAIGRLVPEDIVGMVRYAREHAAAAS